jgi:hypothetical protein
MEDVMEKYHNILGNEPDPIGKMPQWTISYLS